MIDPDDIKRDEQVFGANGDQALQDIADRKRVQTHEDIPDLDDDPILPIEEDTIEEQIDGEHPDGDYPQDIYDDDPDEPIEDEPADEEDEEAL